MFSLKTNDSTGDELPARPTPVDLNGGNLTCLERQKLNVPRAFFTVDTLESSAEAFCKEVAAKGSVWEATDNLDGSRYWKDSFKGEDSDDEEVVVSMTWSSASLDCPTLDMSADDAVEFCTGRFAGIIHNCDTSNPDGAEKWKQGGYYDKDCVHWYIGRRLI